MVKQTWALVFTFILSFALPFSASASGWNKVGDHYFSSWNGKWKAPYTQAAYVYSTGGNFKVCTSLPNQSLELWSYNPGDNNDEYVGKANTDGDLDGLGLCATWYDIGNYVDGDNGKAEFYVVSTDSRLNQYDRALFYD